MKKKIITIVLAFVMVGAVSTLILYKIGGYFLDSAFEAIMNADQIPSDPNSLHVDSGPATPDSTNNINSLPILSQPDQAQQIEPEPTAVIIPATPSEPVGVTTPPSVQETPKEITPETTSVQEEPKNETPQVYTPEQIADISGSVSASDKLSASLLVLSKLSSEDISYLYGLMEGGLTSEEKAAAKELCFSRFTDEEVELIYDLYKKYTQQ